MLQQTKLKDGISLLNAKPEMKPYLISYAVLWPYHLFLKSNPIELISETFFKHYGDEGHYYLGTRGIKNFFNDLLRGKNRYKNFIIKTDIFEIHKNSKIFEDHEKHFEKLDCLYVKIISGRFNKKYLLKIEYSTNPSYLNKDDAVSRYELDVAQRLNEEMFIKQLREINPKKVDEILANLLV